MSVAMLSREMYDVAEAARLLRVPRETLLRWLDGRGRYEPVIRPAPTGSKNVTWGEFVEAGFLREYRQRRSLRLLRPVVARLRQEFDVMHPFAALRPFVGPGKNLTLKMQQEEDLPDELAVIYEITSGQLVLAPPAVRFMERVDFADVEPRAALRLFPAGKHSPVVIDPEYSFGSPTVKGIRTEVIAELVEAGETIDELAHDYSLSRADIEAAVSYERRLAT